MRYFLEIAYNGSSFSGSQSQPNARTVQGELERGLSLLLREEVSTVFSGRTDAGVHCQQQFAHFDTEATFDPEQLSFRLNRFFDHHIAVRRIFPVKPDAHARFDATRRSYRYVLSRQKDPFAQGLAWMVYGDLDVEGMKACSDIIRQHSDFTSLCKVHTDVTNHICEIFDCHWETEGDKLMLKVTANRFLRGMIRLMVGGMVAVGKGKLSPQAFDEKLKAKDVNLMPASAPADGLYLEEVVYEESIYK